VLHTCNIPSSGVCLETNYSIWMYNFSLYCKGRSWKGLNCKHWIWDHSSYFVYLAWKVYDFTKWQTEKEITYIWRNSMNLVLYWHLKDSGYSRYKIKIQKVVMKQCTSLQNTPLQYKIWTTLCAHEQENTGWWFSYIIINGVVTQHWILYITMITHDKA